MGSPTGFLLGKVRLDGAVRSEVLASLVATLLQRYQVPEAGKKQIKFHDSIRYAVECSERGLKLTSPGFRSRDEGFESDSESLRSIKMNESSGGEIDLIELMDHLDISKGEKETDSGNHHLSSLSSGGSNDNTSISSSSNLHISDDSNSSSGNGSDSDEFSNPTSGERSPSWEPVPNLSSFQSYPIEDVVFCHSDALHPSTLVWVVKHSTKMIALITAFRSRSEAEELFQKYRDIRLKVKPVKHKMNPFGAKVLIPPVPNLPAPPPPPRTCSVLSTTLPENQFNSLPHPSRSTFNGDKTTVLSETQSKPQLFSIVPEPIKSIDFESSTNNIFGFNPKNSFSSSSISKMPRAFNSLSFQHLHFSPNGRTDEGLENDMRSNSMSKLPESETEEDSDDDDDESQVTRIRAPIRGTRKLQIGFGKNKSMGSSSKPVLLVPLKNESVSTPRSSYPKESYLYHVMGRTSSTFAPYQRSLNFIPPYAMGNGSSNGGTEYLSWANSNGRHLVPFSSWVEQSEGSKHIHHSSSQHGAPIHPRMHITPKSLRRGISKTSTLSHLTGKGTAKILLRDSSGHHDGMWANLSQRVKHNFRQNVIPKFNGIWNQPGDSPNRVKKKQNKKVTFNAWATVQMV